MLSAQIANPVHFLYQFTFFVSRIPKDILNGELAQGKASAQLAVPFCASKTCFKRDLVGMKIDSWEQLADDRPKWRATVHEHVVTSEARRHEFAAETRRMAAQQKGTSVTKTCDLCGRQCLSRIGLHSHKRRCSSSTTTSLFFIPFCSFYLYFLSLFLYALRMLKPMFNLTEGGQHL